MFVGRLIVLFYGRVVRCLLCMYRVKYTQGASARRAKSRGDDARDAEVAQGKWRGRHPRGHHAEPEVPPEVIELP